MPGETVLWDDLRANQLVAVGDPDTVAEAIATLREAGATDVLCLADFGGLGQEQVMRSLELFMREVAQRFGTRQPSLVSGS